MTMAFDPSRTSGLPHASHGTLIEPRREGSTGQYPPLPSGCSSHPVAEPKSMVNCMPGGTRWIGGVSGLLGIVQSSVGTQRLQPDRLVRQLPPSDAGCHSCVSY